MDWIQSHETIENELAMLEEGQADVMALCQSAMLYCGGILEGYRGWVSKEGFKDTATEIRFFKEEKPFVMGKWIYYQQMGECELRMPKWGRDSQRDFLERELQRLNSFFDQQLDLRLYLEMGDTSKDTVYFTREHLHYPSGSLGYDGYRDKDFNTYMDLAKARLLGLGQFGAHIQKRISDLEGITGQSVPMKRPFRFTHPVTAAMEIIYAFKEAGMINHGDFEIKAFADYFGMVFGIEIKDPFGLYKQIMNRKTSRSKYLRKMARAFENALEERDKYIP